MSLVGRGCEGKSCADRDCDGRRDNGGGRRTRAQLPTRGQVGFTPTSRARGPGRKIARRRRRGWGLSRRRLRCRGPARKFPIGGTMTFHSKLQKSNCRARSCRVDPTASLCPWMRSLFPFPAAQGPDRPDAEAGSEVCIGPVLWAKCPAPSALATWPPAAACSPASPPPRSFRRACVPSSSFIPSPAGTSES